MIARAFISKQEVVAPPSAPASTGLLQRKCARGRHTVADGECAECRNQREATLQLAAAMARLVGDVPRIVHDVLRSPSQPLDPATHAFMEPRFGLTLAEYGCMQMRERRSRRGGERVDVHCWRKSSV